jgi:hypothetical protein
VTQAQLDELLASIAALSAAVEKLGPLLAPRDDFGYPKLSRDPGLVDVPESRTAPPGQLAQLLERIERVS